MGTVTPDVFKVVQNYGGLKEAYFEVNSASASDVIDFSDEGVEGISFKVVTQDSDGSFVACTVASSSGTLHDQLTVGTGPSSAKLVGIIKYRSY